ncbi:MAG TPA: CcmD family protein [Cyclobacteriaceae bacterium]|nr:CcmD family protein [Cyclobacteriaceae bacterium]
MYKAILLIILSLFSQVLWAQEVEMADTMRSEGKIYVVVAILVLILAGLIGYLITIDKKVSNLEKRIPKK